MRNILLTAAVTASLAAASFAGHATEAQFFVDGKVGQSDYHYSNRDFHDTKDVSSNVMFGYRWSPEQRFYIGPELGYIDLGKIGQSANYNFGSISEHDHYGIQSKGALLGVNTKWDLGDRWYLTAHAGVSRLRSETKLDYSFSDGYPAGGYHVKEDANSWYAGLGVGFDINRAIGFGLAYDNYSLKYDNGDYRKTDVGVIAATVEWRF
jgi:opacity protein-like surface antigen